METGDESATACFIICSLFVKNAAFCEGLRLILHVHLTYKDDNLFRNGSIHEWWCLKTCKMSKVHACSREITNKPLRVRTTKTLCLPTWKTNYNAEKCASDVKQKAVANCVWMLVVKIEANERIYQKFVLLKKLLVCFSVCLIFHNL